MASSYEDSEEFIRWYRQNAEAMKGVQTLVLEDQVVEWLLERADVVEETVSFDDIMRPPQPEPVPSTSTESETQ